MTTAQEDEDDEGVPLAVGRRPCGMLLLLAGCGVPATAMCAPSMTTPFPTTSSTATFGTSRRRPFGASGGSGRVLALGTTISCRPRRVERAPTHPTAGERLLGRVGRRPGRRHPGRRAILGASAGPRPPTDRDRRRDRARRDGSQYGDQRRPAPARRRPGGVVADLVPRGREGHPPQLRRARSGATPRWGADHTAVSAEDYADLLLDRYRDTTGPRRGCPRASAVRSGRTSSRGLRATSGRRTSRWPTC